MNSLVSARFSSRRLAGWVLVGSLIVAHSAYAQGTSPSSPGPAAGATSGASTPGDAHRRQDIARHRALATAHESAARCLEAGESESACHERLRRACEGLAIGRYCGMKHAH
jgi:hypothetical protein